MHLKFVILQCVNFAAVLQVFSFCDFILLLKFTKM